MLFDCHKWLRWAWLPLILLWSACHWIIPLYPAPSTHDVVKPDGAGVEDALLSDVVGPDQGVQTGAHLWSRHFGGSNTEYVHGVATDSQGNVLLTGEFRETMQIKDTLQSAGAGDIFVAKLDKDGVPLWSKRFGGAVPFTDAGRAVAVDAGGNVLVTGNYQGTVDFGDGDGTAQGNDIFVIKIDPTGNPLWSKRFGSSGTDIGHDVAADVDGNVLVTGEFQKTVNFGGADLTASVGGSDVFVVKLGSNGDHLWSKHIDGSGVDVGQAVTTDGTGNVLLAGNFDGELLIKGHNHQSAGYTDIFVARLAPDGNSLWAMPFGGPEWDSVVDIASDAQGNLVVTGYLQGTVDFGGGPHTSAGGTDIFVAKLGSNGEHLWSNHYGDQDSEAGRGVATDAHGNVVVAGAFRSALDLGGNTLQSAGSTDIFVAKLDPTGKHVWSHGYGGGNGDGGYAVATDVWGNTLLVGKFREGVDFGDGVLQSHGDNDLFVVKLAP